MKRRFKALAILVVLVLSLVGIYCFQNDAFSLARIAGQEDRLRAWISEYGWGAFAVGFAFYTVASLVPGTAGKSIIFGWLFGFWQSLVLVNGALTLAALAAFFVSRYFFLDLVRRRYHTLADQLNEAWRRDGAYYLLTLRLSPMSYSFTNYASGATGVPVGTFWWTTHLGLLPKVAVYVFLGSQLPSLEILREQGIASLAHPSLFIALALLAFVPLGVRFVVRRELSNETAARGQPLPYKPSTPPKSLPNEIAKGRH